MGIFHSSRRSMKKACWGFMAYFCEWFNRPGYLCVNNKGVWQAVALHYLSGFLGIIVFKSIVIHHQAVKFHVDAISASCYYS